MSGLLFFGFLGGWLYLSNKITRYFVSRINTSLYRFVVHIVLLMSIFSLPVADEIIGGLQFRSLCKNDSIAFVDEQKAKNKILKSRSSSLIFDNYIIPIKKYTFTFNDVESDQVVVSWIHYSAKGGWLARKLDFGTSHTPFLFGSDCSPEYSGNTIVKKLNIKLD